MKIGFGDTETLSPLNVACNGEKQLVDSFGLITIESEKVISADTVTMLISQIGPLIAESVGKAVFHRFDLVDTMIVVYQDYPEVLTQLNWGRVFSPETYSWHTKRGYDPSLVNRRPMKAVLEDLASMLVGVRPMFFRGTDFDVPIWTSVMAQNNLRFVKYNRVRDIRTAIDELVNGEDGYVGEKHMIDITNGNSRKIGNAYKLIEKVEKEAEWLDAIRHSALVDAYLDALWYLTLKYIVTVLHLNLNVNTIKED